MVNGYIWLSMRHFLTDAYRNNIYMGQQQYPICNTDIKTNGYLEDLRTCVIYASPLKRSSQTVEFLIKKFPDTKFEISYLDGLKERGLGNFEGKPKEQIRCNADYFIEKKFIVTKTPPNGESFCDFRDRVEKAVKIIFDKSFSNNILVVSHLQTLRMIRFCVNNIHNYDTWHNVNYSHGEVVKEDYGEKQK